MKSNADEKNPFLEETTLCAAEGCRHPGVYRAPKSKDDLHDYIFLCLDHVREYNKAWNFYEGMTEDEIAWQQKQDMTGHRPSWPFGLRGMTREDMLAMLRRKGGVFFADGFDASDISDPDSHEKFCFAQFYGYAPLSAEGKALILFALAPPLTVAKIKKRYKELVKEYHPDLNPDQDTKKIQEITEAYATLKQMMKGKKEIL